MLITIGIMAYAGILIDRWLKIQFPAFLLGFTFLGFGGSMYLLVKAVNKDNTEDEVD